MTRKIRTIISFAIISYCMIMSSCRGSVPTAIATGEANSSSTELIEIQKPTLTSTPEPINPVEGYAVLAEKDDYSDVGMTDLPVDYIDNARVREALLGLGWKSEQIHELEGFDRNSLQTELDWLEDVADENDVVLFYVSAHGTYLSDNIAWAEFVPIEWSQIISLRRLLIVDACTAGEFTDAIKRDPKPHISIAAVDKDELGWKGLEEEGLPIVGGVFTYYFTEALSSTAADSNNDGLISVREAAKYSEEKQRTYMHEVVFAVPQFVEDFHAIGYEPDKDPTYPDVIVDDTIIEQLFLKLDTYMK